MDKKDFDNQIPELTNYLRNRVFMLSHDREKANDLVQDTIVKAYRYLDNFDGRHIRGWLYNIMYRIFLNKLDLKENRFNFISFGETINDDKSYLINDVLSSKNSPEKALEDKILRNTLKDAFRKVPRKFRKITYMALGEGYSYTELAKVFVIKEGTVKSRINRGRTILKKALFQTYKKCA